MVGGFWIDALVAAGLNAISADPVYSRAWDRGWRALRSGVGGSPTEERLWTSPTWEIYERLSGKPRPATACRLSMA
jgi:hypothetical protein